jgi:hypothetical protein
VSPGAAPTHRPAGGHLPRYGAPGSAHPGTRSWIVGVLLAPGEIPLVTAPAPRDLHLRNGQWEPVDILGECPDGEEIGEYLTSQGWERFQTIGDPEAGLGIESWQRNPADKPSQYLMLVSETSGTSPFMLLDSYPEFISLVARWAPAVQAAMIGHVLYQAQVSFLQEYGLVEMVAAKVAHGIGPVLTRMQKDKKNA